MLNLKRYYANHTCILTKLTLEHTMVVLSSQQAKLLDIHHWKHNIDKLSSKCFHG